METTYANENNSLFFVVYSFEFDIQSHGIVLCKTANTSAVEVRPVYPKEMLYRGFDKFWKFTEDNSTPIMWAIGLDFYYDGELMISLAKPKTLDEKIAVKYLNEDSLEKYLEPVDINLMNQKNANLIKNIEQKTQNFIYDIYKKYYFDVDMTLVAYSSGKDSEALLALCMGILPKDKYTVQWTNTGIETKNAIKQVQKRKTECIKQGIQFNEITPPMKAEEAWNKIGPPANGNRWCCHVLQATPQIIYYRQKLKNKNMKGLVFLGNRADESVSRAKLKLVNDRICNTNTIQCNPILDWSSAEIYLYLYNRNIDFNDEYKQGFSRVGCALCPFRTLDVLNYSSNIKKSEASKWYSIIEKFYDNKDDSEYTSRVKNEALWTNRIDATGTKLPHRYKEYIDNFGLHIEYKDLRVSWKIWIKTLGDLIDEGNNCFRVNFESNTYHFTVEKTNTWTSVILNDEKALNNKKFIDLFKSVFRKAVFCVLCHDCEAQCAYGYIKMADNKLEISDECKHCYKCHKLPRSCFSYMSQHFTSDCL